MSTIVAPSLLSANFGNLSTDIDMVNCSEAEWLHLDIMDGVFVPNISFGFPVMKYVRSLSTKPLDVHLMIVEPDKYIERFEEHGAHMLTVHYEACTHLHRCVQMIRQAGMKAGVALNPHSPVSSLENILPEVDMVLIMTVNPGYGGQRFISESMSKIRQLKEMIDRRNLSALIQVDGGVGTHNARELIDAGVDVLVAGNAVFGSDDPQKTISEIKNPA